MTYRYRYNKYKYGLNLMKGDLRLKIGIDEVFRSEWKTDNPGVSTSTQITLPLEASGSYNFTVDWGDGDSDLITVWNQAETTHTYASSGTYNVEITGTLVGWTFNNNGDRRKITKITRWGVLELGNTGGYFSGCLNLFVMAGDQPVLGTNLNSAFNNCELLTDVGTWNTSGVTDMSSMFANCDVFNQDISAWNVSSVTTMNNMFFNCPLFNQDLNSWVVTSVADMNSLFNGALAFNGNISSWTTTSLNTMTNIFKNTAFNQDISGWDVSGVSTINGAFNGASAFNQDISSWTTGLIANMGAAFSNATSFDQDLGSWDITSLSTASSMFDNVTLSTANYDSLLVGWEAQIEKNNVSFSGGNSTYTLGVSGGARFRLVDTSNWTITDGGTNNIAFVSSWKTDNTGVSTNLQVKLPLEASGTYDFYIEWGDSTPVEHITVWNQAETTHTYAGTGTYTVKIGGQTEGWTFNNAGDEEKLLTISRWEDLDLGNSGGYFNGCSNLVITATGQPAIGSDLSNAFAGCSSITQIGTWDVSGVTTMLAMFANTNVFNQNINGWDVSGVIVMQGLFINSVAFNQDLNSWNVSSVEDMAVMFSGASLFNGNITAWVPTSLTNMNNMFQDTPFNQDISSWATTGVLSMSGVFLGATAFNQNISTWDTGDVTTMASMFSGATSFQQDLGSWDITSLTDAASMFLGVTLTVDNYSNLLTGWEGQVELANVSFHGGNSKYNAGAGSLARADLISASTWTITDGGIDDNFASQWKSDNTSAGSSTSTQVKLPLHSSGVYDFHIDWGDDSSDHITAWDQTEVTHTYSIAGTYNIKMSGTIDTWLFNNLGDKSKILDVSDWGPLDLGSIGFSFEGCNNLDVTATNQPVLTNLSAMFRGCSSLTTIGTWDVSAIALFENMFEGCTLYNQDISGWTTDAATSMQFMFLSCPAFNRALNTWNVSGVTKMQGMFQGCTIFNQALNSWVVSSVLNMQSMFQSSGMNGNIAGWNVSSVTDMLNMFRSASVFNVDLSTWVVTSVTNMSAMFLGSAFNQDISSWGVGAVTNMSNMFVSNSVFNQDLSSWDVSKVTTMNGMFASATAFNQDISGWTTTVLADTGTMFANATAFDQNLGGWDIADVTVMTAMFDGVTLSTVNYDAILIGWEGGTVQSNVNFHGGSSLYSAGAAATARANLISNSTWTITDGGPV